MELENCPLCHNHCSVDSLSCNKGRDYFSAGSGSQTAEETENDKQEGKTYSGEVLETEHSHENEDNHENGHEDNRGHSHEDNHEHGHENNRGQEHKNRREHGHEGRCGHEHEDRREHGHEDMYERGHGSRCEEDHIQEEHRGKGKRKVGEFEQKDDLSSLLKACGHFLHHRSGRGDTQMQILRLLNQGGEMQQQDIQDMLRVRPGSISEVITKLENKGLVERKKDEEDQRRIVLAITDEGKKTCAESTEEENAELFTVLDDQQQEELKKTLKILLEKWKDE